jgi:tetratricopeptide (TPR) repeat protein
VSILTIVFIYIILRVVILKLPFFVITTPSTLFQRLPGFFVALTEYSKLLLLPFNLHMEYGNKLLAFYHPKVLVGIIILFSLISYAFKKRKTDNLMFFSIFWFFIGLLPVSNLYPINAYMAEHWLYLPSLGFFLILANGLILIWNNEKIRPVITILIICILLFYSCLTIMQNIYWKEPLNFYNRILKYKPNSFKLYHNLGKTYSDMGYSYAAIKAYSKAIEINSKSSETYNNLGTVYSHMGKLQEAIELYKKALEIDPQYADCYFNLGNAYSAINDTQEAILYYKKAIDIDPQNAHAYAYYNNLASMYALLGDMAKATLFYAKALEINPDFKTARENLNKIR